ncbi:E1-E2 ATPase-domain-containing protein [Papiliotrema laurentii]|uniref:E1-E2 ATPase-domain-containing protein n=1 Tax=Papiliotrema laurentii TaxID=5418 RepID=A0AAD9FPM9_PAPLA|nr:E1-E2 ATPase-domain-containing protein [Papiliotrema laurentii]
MPALEPHPLILSDSTVPPCELSSIDLDALDSNENSTSLSFAQLSILSPASLIDGEPTACGMQGSGACCSNSAAAIALASCSDTRHSKDELEKGILKTCCGQIPDTKCGDQEQFGCGDANRTGECGKAEKRLTGEGEGPSPTAGRAEDLTCGEIDRSKGNSRCADGGDVRRGAEFGGEKSCGVDNAAGGSIARTGSCYSAANIQEESLCGREHRRSDGHGDICFTADVEKACSGEGRQPGCCGGERTGLNEAPSASTGANQFRPSKQDARCAGTAATALAANTGKAWCCRPRRTPIPTHGRFPKLRSRQGLCRCCIDVMLKEHSLDAIALLFKQVKQDTERLRQCCLALLGVCDPSATEDESSCGTSTDCNDHIYASSEAEEETDVQVATRSFARLPSIILPKYTALISGMDCLDCLVKVRRAIVKIEGVDVVRLDHVQGLVEFSVSQESVDPRAVCRFIASVTGFGVTLDTQATPTPAGSLPLRIAVRLAQTPPVETIAAFGQRAEYKLDGNTLHVTLRPHDPAAILPRELIALLEPFGPTLLDSASPSAEDRILADLRHIALRTLVCAVLTIPVLILVWSPLQGESNTKYTTTSLVLSTLTLIVGYPLYRSSITVFWYLREIDLGLLASVSIISAYVFSIIAYGFEMAGQRFADTLFETVGLLITLIFLGRTVQVYSRRLAVSMLKGLNDLQPKVAVLVDKATEELQAIDVRLIHVGDIIRIGTGEIVPTDGIVVSGQAILDESAISGESTPVVKTTGNVIPAGNTLVDGSIDITVTHLVHENSVASMKTAVQSAQSSDAKFADLADKFASYLLPCATAAALVALLVWTMINRFVRGSSWGAAVVEGVTYAIAVLAVSCPCALALAVSSVVSVSIAVAVREGIIFRSADTFRRVADVKSWAFDKTGTLSQSKLSVAVADDGGSDISQLLAHILTHAVKHPVAAAVHQHIAASKPCDTTGRDDALVSIPGAGVETLVLGYVLRGGSPKFTNTTGHPRVTTLVNQGFSVFTVTFGSQLIAVYGLLDVARPGAERLIADLTQKSQRVVMITGDNEEAAHRFASRIGLSLDSVHGPCSPERKGELVAMLRKDYGSVAFVGDGINDSIALASSDVAISLGSGTDAAVSLAHIVLLGTDINRGISATLDLARLSNAHVIAALVWCGIYFVFAILLASGAFVKWRIPPSYAGLGELVSVLPVLLIAGSVWLTRAAQLRGGACLRRMT